MSNLNKYLKDFKLAGVSKSLDLRIQEASENNLSYSDFLELIFEDERLNRADNKEKKLYTKAKLPFQKYIEDFDFLFQASISKKQILELASCKFVPKAENIIFIGNPGTGKTHLSIGIGLKALGYGYQVLFSTVWDMITTLQHSRADLTYTKKIEYYSKPDLLILDELGYRTMGETTIEDFFEIVSRRYEKKATIITSNKGIDKWSEIFIDKALTEAVADRLLHNGYVVKIEGKSYRRKDMVK